MGGASVILASSTDIEQHEHFSETAGEDAEDAEEEAKPQVLRYSMEFLMKFQHVRKTTNFRSTDEFLVERQTRGFS